MDAKVLKAKKLLLSKFDVDPVAYTFYNNAYLFIAYPKGIKTEERREVMNPIYLVDLKLNSVGHFSVAFDINGFFKAAENFKEIK